MDDWDYTQRWRQILERRLIQIGSQIKGSQDFAADRIADVVEQIEELRKELDAVKARQDKIAEYVRAHVPNKKTKE